MTRLVSVKQHVRTVQAPSPKYVRKHDELWDWFVGAILVAALEEALADWRPEEV